jgi:arginase family enzyme
MSGPGPAGLGPRSQPLPGWAGISTLFGAPLADQEAAAAGADVVAAGVPFDATATSRPGAAEGPEAIRRASRVFAEWAKSLGDPEMLDMRTGDSFRYRPPRLVDAGDFAVFPTSPERQFESVRAAAAAASANAGLFLALGGDHSITYPLFAGVSDSLGARDPDARLAYVHVDHHFDFGDTSAVHGSLYHGSNTRRISELPGMGLDRVAFVGAGDVTRRAQLESLRAEGALVVSAGEVRRAGPAAALQPVLERLAAAATAVYVSVDIDAVDAAGAPGTGHVTLGGLSLPELHDVLAQLTRLPVVALDLVEVAPRYDASGRTAQAAARLLFEFLYRDRG